MRKSKRKYLDLVFLLIALGAYCFFFASVSVAKAGITKKNSSEGAIDVKAFGNLSSAKASFARRKGTILITNQQSINDLTIPKNVRLKFVGSGSLYVKPGRKLTIHGAVGAPSKAIFGGAGEVEGLSVCYPQWFGASGGIDDTQAIQKSINSLRPGGHLKLEALSFISSGNVITKSNLVIEGKGRLVKKENTGGNLLHIRKARNITVRQVSFDGNRVRQSITGNNIALIYVEASSDITLTKLDIRNSQGSGIHFFHSTKGVISNNVIRNSHDNGITVGGANTKDVSIIHNFIDTTTTQDGIFITASPGSQPSKDNIFNINVDGNIVRNAGDIGIELGQNCNMCQVTNNNIYNSKNPNIIVRDVKGCSISGNTLRGNFATEIYNRVGVAVIPLRLKDYDYNLKVFDNTITADGFGIDIQTSGVSAYGNTIVGNAAFLSGSRGIRAFKRANTIIANTVNGFDIGVVIGETSKGDAVSNVNIRSNLIKNVNEGVSSWLHKITNVVVSNNTISNHKSYALKFDACIDGTGFVVNHNKASTESMLYHGLRPQQLP